MIIPFICSWSLLCRQYNMVHRHVPRGFVLMHLVGLLQVRMERGEYQGYVQGTYSSFHYRLYVDLQVFRKSCFKWRLPLCYAPSTCVVPGIHWIRSTRGTVLPYTYVRVVLSICILARAYFCIFLIWNNQNEGIDQLQGKEAVFLRLSSSSTRATGKSVIVGFSHREGKQQIPSHGSWRVRTEMYGGFQIRIIYVPFTHPT